MSAPFRRARCNLSLLIVRPPSMSTAPVNRWPWVAWCAAMVVGCSGPTTSPFEKYERLPTNAALSTLSLGKYVVSVPIDREFPHGRMQVQLEFELYVAFLPEHRRLMETEFARLEGRLRDRVIDACRSTRTDDLVDPTLTTLKAHLVETVQPFFAHAPIERIHVTDVQVKSL